MLLLDKKDSAEELTPEQLGRFLTLYDTAKIVGKAAGKTAYARLEAGAKVPGRKLVKAKSNRVWKDDAEALHWHYSPFPPVQYDPETLERNRQAILYSMGATL